MENNSKIYVAGHTGLVGSALLQVLQKNGFQRLLYRTSGELDLRNQQKVTDFFKAERPEYVFLAAAKVGGIYANLTFPAEFIYDNLVIQANIIHNAYLFGVKKLLFLGSSCIYPRMAPQPIKEEYLLSGGLESTNEPYAIAKIAGIKMCQAYSRQYGTEFISIMPPNLYGPNDNFDLETSHVLPALIKKFHNAKVQSLPEVEIWGTGSARREFLYVDDLAEVCLFLMDNYSDSELINVGTGEDIAINDLAELIKNIIGYHGKIVWNSGKPDGTPRKLLDVAKLTDMGWKAETSLKSGIEKTYQWLVSAQN